MVWWGVRYEGVTEPSFFEKGIKSSAQAHQDTFLEKAAKPLNTMFNNQERSFRQDSAPNYLTYQVQVVIGLAVKG